MYNVTCICVETGYNTDRETLLVFVPIIVKIDFKYLVYLLFINLTTNLPFRFREVPGVGSPSSPSPTFLRPSRLFLGVVSDSDRTNNHKLANCIIQDSSQIQDSWSKARRIGVNLKLH